MGASPSERLDRLGVFASVGCAIHCLVAPIILLLSPALGGIWAHPTTHLAIATLVLPVAASAFRRGFRDHGRRWVLVGGALGMVFVFIGTVWPFVLEWTASADAEACAACECCPSLVPDEATGVRVLKVPLASILTLVGGTLLVASHIGNLRHCSHCR